MYYGNIKKYDIADGEGVRVTLFVSGCTNHCKGCFQKETWNFLFGKPYTEDTEKEILDALDHYYIAGATFLGGEPFEFENQKELAKLAAKIKERYPDKTIWSYTGFTYDEDLVPGGKRYGEYTDALLDNIDVLVDGRFIEEKKNLALKFRGSENQRVIYLKETRKTGNIIKYLP